MPQKHPRFQLRTSSKSEADFNDIRFKETLQYEIESFSLCARMQIAKCASGKLLFPNELATIQEDAFLCASVSLRVRGFIHLIIHNLKMSRIIFLLQIFNKGFLSKKYAVNNKTLLGTISAVVAKLHLLSELCETCFFSYEEIDKRGD